MKVALVPSVMLMDKFVLSEVSVSVCNYVV